MVFMEEQEQRLQISESTHTYNHIVFFLLHVQLYRSKIKESSEDTNARLEAKVHTLFSTLFCVTSVLL